jgi:hypothetical protein
MVVLLPALKSGLGAGGLVVLIGCYATARIHLARRPSDSGLKWAAERATEVALMGNGLYLSCFSLNCAVNLSPRLVVNLHVVLLTTVLQAFCDEFDNPLLTRARLPVLLLDTNPSRRLFCRGEGD